MDGQYLLIIMKVSKISRWDSNLWHSQLGLPAELADIVPTARLLPNGKSYSAKFIPGLAGGQSNAASKSSNAEGRRDSQGIDPLSHVCSKWLKGRMET